MRGPALLSTALIRPAVIAAFAMLFAAPGFTQNAEISPLRITAGSVVNFQLQSRLSPTNDDAADALPAGTTLRVRLTDPVDSQMEEDGAAFQGVLVSPVEQNNHVVIAANAEAHGLLALLRSRQHPEGFRYELLVTNLVDGGKSYVVTASLDSSLFESPKQPAPAPESSAITVDSGATSSN
jgi:hypothetical protein